jgi:hypothetical protein
VIDASHSTSPASALNSRSSPSLFDLRTYSSCASTLDDDSDSDIDSDTESYNFWLETLGNDIYSIVKGITNQVITALTIVFWAQFILALAQSVHQHFHHCGDDVGLFPRLWNNLLTLSNIIGPEFFTTFPGFFKTRMHNGRLRIQNSLKTVGGEVTDRARSNGDAIASAVGVNGSVTT